jgi:hypothetical protein
MSTEPELTEAEHAAAVALADWHNAHSSTSRLAVGAFTAEARAVVAAARPHLLAQFCIEAADAVDQLGPIDGNHLRIMAHQLTTGDTDNAE